MNVLMVWPEESYTMPMHTKIPKRWAYFVEIASYLKRMNYTVRTIDCLNPEISHGEVFAALSGTRYDVVIMIARIESARSIRRLAPTIRQLAPETKVIIYGDISNYAPNFFMVHGVDAVVMDGDWECAIVDYLKYVAGEIEEAEMCGVSYRRDGVWHTARKGREVPNNGWSFPNRTLNPADSALYLSITDGELTMSVSRGCPFNCHFCPAVITFREHDRRKHPDEIIEYVQRHQQSVAAFKFFSPTFTIDVDWVKGFCHALLSSGCRIRWSATTRPNCLGDEEMVRLMSESGCYKLAIGVETLDSDSTRSLGKFSVADHVEQTREAILLLRRYNIEAKALMMLGIEGQTATNIYRTFSLLQQWGADIRAASYSPRDILKVKDTEGTLEVDEIELLDKMVYQHVAIPGMTRTQYLNLVYNTHEYGKILNQPREQR